MIDAKETGATIAFMVCGDVLKQFNDNVDAKNPADNHNGDDNC
ncbi:MAG: hypothetical protein WCE45_11425 [Sedimentisphaerales bacterium]